MEDEKNKVFRRHKAECTPPPKNGAGNSNETGDVSLKFKQPARRAALYASELQFLENVICCKSAVCENVGGETGSKTTSAGHTGG